MNNITTTEAALLSLVALVIIAVFCRNYFEIDIDKEEEEL